MAQDNWTSIIQIISQLGLNSRLKASYDEEVSDWESVIIEPSSSYIEPLNYGPLLKTDIEWLEIDTVLEKKLGKLIKSEKIDLKEELLNLLNQKNIVFFDFGQIIRITF